MVNFKRLLFQSSLTFTLFFLFGAGSAFAASVYAVTEATATVGANASLEIEYTVDTTDQTWADGDTLTLALPANFPEWSALTFTVENDGDVTNNATNETAITAGAGNGQYVLSSRTITVKWDVSTWGAVNDDAETIRFLITAANVPTYANATSIFIFGGTTVAADTNINSNDTVNVSADALSATNVEPYVFVQSTLTTDVVTFTTSIQIPSGGKISITYPSGFDVSGLEGTTAQRLSGLTGTWTASVSGQVATFTQSGGSATSAGALSFEVVPARNPAATGTSGTYTITTKDSSGNSIETDAAVAGDIFLVGSSATIVVGEAANIVVSDAADGNGVVISWTDPDDDTTAIEILRGISPLPVDGDPIVEVPVDVETYTDIDVEVGDIVTYQLRATFGSHTGELTDELTFTVGSSTATTDDTDTGTDTTDDTTVDVGTTDETGTDDKPEDVVTLTDIEGHWAQSAIEFMTDVGVVEGNPDGTFDPNGKLNRASAAALVWRVLGNGDAPAEINADPFQDVNLSAWYAPYIADLKDLDLVAGNPDETFQPAEEINRAEFLKLALNVYLYLNPDMVDSAQQIMDSGTTSAYADIDSTLWYAETVTVATQWDFVEGSSCGEATCFNAGNSITRAEATKILYNMFADIL